MPKTGSTTLQNVFFRAINDSKYSYADLKAENQSSIIYSLFSEEPEGHTLHKEMKHTKKDIDAYNKHYKALLVNYLNNTKSSTTIISGEDIFHMNEYAITQMKHFLLNYFEKIIIVGYVRHHISFMNSAFQQLVKHHYIHSFNFNIIYPQYKYKLEKFDKVFGRENVHFINFNPKKFPNQDIVNDFSNRFNVPFNYDKKQSINETISKELMSILFIDNKFNKKTFGKYNTLVKLNLIQNLQAIGNTKFSFSSEIIDNINKVYKDDIEWIYQRMDKDFSDVENQEDGIGTVKLESELLTISDDIFYELIRVIGKKNIKQNLLFNTTENIAKIIEEYKEHINLKVIENKERKIK